MLGERLSRPRIHLASSTGPFQGISQYSIEKQVVFDEKRMLVVGRVDVFGVSPVVVALENWTLAQQTEYSLSEPKVGNRARWDSVRSNAEEKIQKRLHFQRTSWDLPFLLANYGRVRLKIVHKDMQVWTGGRVMMETTQVPWESNGTVFVQLPRSTVESLKSK